jgi:tetratricopeptide (TPR) repeat protein
LEFDDYRLLGLAYRQTKKDSLAAMTWEEMLKDTTQSVKSRSYFYGEVGSIWMKFKDWERAAMFFEKRIQIDTTSGSVGSAINYALCMIQLDRFENASSALKRAIAQNPKYPPAYINLGYCYFQQKNYDDGKKEFETAIKVIDTMESKYRLELGDANRMIALAIMLEKKTPPEENQKKWENALVYLKKSVKFKEDIAQTHLWMGQSYQNLNKKDDAIKEYKRTLQLDPKNEQAKKGLEAFDVK